MVLRGYIVPLRARTYATLTSESAVVPHVHC